jgi:hypothetical protein
MEDKIITLKVKHNLDDVAGKVDKVNDNLAVTDKKVDQITDSTKKAESGINKMAKAFTGLGLALKGAGIGLAIEGFQLFKDTLSANQKVLNLFNTSLTATKMIFTDIIKLASGDLSISQFIDNLGQSWDKATDTTNLQNNAKIAEATQQGLVAKYSRLAELQRQIRDDESLTFEQRIKANEELGDILKQQGAEMEKLAKIQIDAAQADFDLMPNTDTQVALINAKNNLADIQEQITGFYSEQKTNRISLLKEQQLVDTEGMIAEVDRVQAKYDAIKAIEEKYFTEIRDLKANSDQKALDQWMVNRQKEIDALEADAAIKNNLYGLLFEEYGIKQTELDKKLTLERIDHLNAYADASMAVAQLIGQQTAEGKALAIAASLISTYTAIAKQLEAFSGVPVPGYAIAQAIATGAVGLAQVSSIMSTQVPGESNVGYTMANTPSAPRFNVVGASPINQVAELMKKENAPVKAYVVSSDVSTAQALDRNRITSATLG